MKQNRSIDRILKLSIELQHWSSSVHIALLFLPIKPLILIDIHIALLFLPMKPLILIDSIALPDCLAFSCMCCFAVKQKE